MYFNDVNFALGLMFAAFSGAGSAPLDTPLKFSTPVFSTIATWCHVFHSRVFHPCYLVPRFPLPRFPPLLLGAAFSTPAFSTPAFSAPPNEVGGRIWLTQKFWRGAPMTDP